MAIVQERINIGGRDFIRTYSDRNVLVRGGTPEDDYAEVCDPTEFGRTYTETDTPIEPDETALADKAEAYDILMGVNT